MNEDDIEYCIICDEQAVMICPSCGVLYCHDYFVKKTEDGKCLDCAPRVRRIEDYLKTPTGEEK